MPMGSGLKGLLKERGWVYFQGWAYFQHIVRTYINILLVWLISILPKQYQDLTKIMLMK